MQEISPNKNELEAGNVPAGIMATKRELLNSKAALLDGEDKSIFNELKKGLMADLRPVGTLEMLLAEKIIADYWRLRRFLKIEAITMDWWKDYELEEKHTLIDERSRTYEIISNNPHRLKKCAIKNMVANINTDQLLRYENSIQNSISKNWHELQRLQAARMGKQTFLPAIVDINVLKE